MGFKQFRSEPLTEAEKRYLRRKNGIVQPHSAAVGPAPVSKPSDDPKFVAPYTIGKISKNRRFSGCRLSDDIRASVERKRELNQAFHAALRRELASR
jgi:hypothetical protein